ncbi:MAG: hypothetical protein IT560_03490 [Alphaproteobacteria bacterium]|nr:hypothetical protein [Alphaproteobacteria bacterium]
MSRILKKNSKSAKRHQAAKIAVAKKVAPAEENYEEDILLKKMPDLSERDLLALSGLMDNPAPPSEDMLKACAFYLSTLDEKV